jgi:5-methyltetrahydropteroyltriglutamate--homocysteine methyltransferase
MAADRILTTHVGSLIRPPKLIEFWRAIEDGKPYDAAAFEACLTESVAEVVRQQADAGIDIVSDGEFSKGLNWAFYIFKRLKGISVRPATAEELKDPMASMAGGRDRDAFPEFYAEYDAASGLAKRLGNRVVVNEPLSYVGADQVGRDIRNIKAGIAKAKQQYPALAGFLPVVVPASALPNAKNEHYRDEEAFLFGLALGATLKVALHVGEASEVPPASTARCWCRRRPHGPPRIETAPSRPPSA